MPSTNKTPNYQLTQFTGTDKPSWLQDYNSDMAKIDEELKTLADNSGINISVVQDTGTSTTSVMSQNAVSANLNTLSTNISTKQPILVAGVNIKNVGGQSLIPTPGATGETNITFKTINNQSIIGSGNIDIDSSDINVVQSTGTSTTSVMSQNAVTTALQNKANSSDIPTLSQSTGTSTSSTMSQNAITTTINNIPTFSAQKTAYSGIKTASGTTPSSIITTPSLKNNTTYLIIASASLAAQASSTTEVNVVAGLRQSAAQFPNNDVLKSTTCYITTNKPQSVTIASIFTTGANGSTNVSFIGYTESEATAQFSNPNIVAIELP